MSNFPDYITRTELQRMVDACDPTTLAGKRDRLLLVVLRALNGRSGEAAGLRSVDVTIASIGITLWVPTGHMLVPDGEYTSHRVSDLLTVWLSGRPQFADSHLPLFRSITQHDRPRGADGLSPWAINQIVKRAAARAGLDNPERYTARIMRGPVRRKVSEIK